MNMSDKNASSAKPSRALHSLLKIEEGLQLPEAERIEQYLYEEYNSDSNSWKRKAYYFAKPIIPRSVQLALRRKYTAIQSARTFPAWPIEPVVVKAAHSYLSAVVSLQGNRAVHTIAPWPEGYRAAFVITHDVEWDAGLRNATRLADLEKKYGFTSSWNLVPERYPIDWKIVDRLRADGFEIGLHGLKHDGKDFQSLKIFRKRLKKMHEYARSWGAVGFRSPATHRNVEWMPELPFEYD